MVNQGGGDMNNRALLMTFTCLVAAYTAYAGTLSTPEGTEKIIRQVFTDRHFARLILLDHDATFTLYTPHRTHEVDLRDIQTLLESGQFDRAQAERSVADLSRPFYAAKVVYCQGFGIRLQQWPIRDGHQVDAHGERIHMGPWFLVAL
jgi:hypothetical protein